ncbi:MAG: (deoxy)nucleoside triphosphate pyrophosphohydrolase [Betaproteobacteria bacterium]|nr:(deoxy)nucleoside triphosphate pyrophosphohydrolase [Betaproteobacteria bacterium]
MGAGAGIPIGTRRFTLCAGLGWPTLTQSALVDVAVGIIRRPDGAVLMTSRPLGKPYAGYWEFPGGKLETKESSTQALSRELSEEIGISIQRSSPVAWQIEHNYAHAKVRLFFHWVTQWSGEPKSLEKQQTLWVSLGDAWPYPVLPATLPLLDKIKNYRASAEMEYLVR